MTSPADLVLTEEFEDALAILEAGGNLFLTGKAGTGKSTLIRHYMASTDRRVIVAAPTGIAALNVDGYTLHRLFGFTTGTTTEDIASGRYRPGRFAGTLKRIQTLIIDEASMVRADLFDQLAGALERYGPRPGEPFGGVQIVLVGDLFQLPPVVPDGEAGYLADRYETPYFFSADAFDRQSFPTVALTTVFRQLGDDRLTDILNAIREGVLLGEAQSDLNERTDPDFTPPDDEFWLTLAPTNRIVTARNRERLAELDAPEWVHHAHSTGDLTAFDPPVEKKLQFKEGAQVMMLSNDPADRWVNGTLGRIDQIAETDDGVRVLVEFTDGSAAEFGPHLWEVTRPVVEGGSLRHEVIGTYTQLPFKLAWAITIHKSQGQTLDRLIVDLTGGAFDFGQVYVALSRCTSMDGLILKRPVLAKDLKTDRRILRFLHASGPRDRPTRYCGIGLLPIGDEGRLSRPRPVELAVAFDDGTALTTLINPERDLADARSRYGITVDDVLLAPTLDAAWSAIGPLVDGYTPVAFDADLTLGLIDFELKRLGTVARLPLAADAPPPAGTLDERRHARAPRALDRARAALRAWRDSGGTDPSTTPFERFEGAEQPSHLLTRDPDAPPPEASSMPTLAALVDLSRDLSAIVLHGETAATVARRRETSVPAGVKRAIVSRLTTLSERTSGLPAVLADRLRELEELLDDRFVDDLVAGGAHARGQIHDVLQPETRICFTGTTAAPDGRIMAREDMNELARFHGLVPVANVSKTRCDVLIVAEVGTQSGKARKAVEFGKPVFSAEEFFAWTAR